MAAGCCIERAEVFRQVFLRRTAVAGTGAGGGKGGSAESSPGDMARRFLVLFSRGGESGLSRLLEVALESSDCRHAISASTLEICARSSYGQQGDVQPGGADKGGCAGPGGGAVTRQIDGIAGAAGAAEVGTDGGVVLAGSTMCVEPADLGRATDLRADVLDAAVSDAADREGGAHAGQVWLAVSAASGRGGCRVGE